MPSGIPAAVALLLVEGAMSQCMASMPIEPRMLRARASESIKWTLLFV